MYSSQTAVIMITAPYVRSHREACTIAISQVLVQASLDHQNNVKYVQTVI